MKPGQVENKASLSFIDCAFYYLLLKNEIRSLKSRDWFDSGGLHLLCKGAERVAEGLCGQVEESLQEDVNLQRVEAFALI